MDKNDISDLLEENHQDLFTWLENQPDENWEKGPKHKWSTSQHIQHLVNSLQLLNNALSYPRFILKYKFGTCNRETRDYETVSKKYQEKLQQLSYQAEEIAENVSNQTTDAANQILSELQASNPELYLMVMQRLQGSNIKKS